MARSRSKPRGSEALKALKLSVMVIDRIKDTMSLWSSVEAYKEKLAAAIRERYAPRLRPGEELPDYVLALELAVRDVQEALRHLIACDDAVAYASTDLKVLRLEHDRLVREELYPSAVSVRGSIDLAFGRKEAVWIHGMTGRTRRDATALVAQLRRLVHRLTDRKRDLPAPGNPHAVVDREGWIRQIVPIYRQVEALDRDVVSHRDHGAPLLVRDKRLAIEAFDNGYRDALRQVRAAFHAARFPTLLLKNLRPYYERRRLSQRAKTKREARAAAKAGQATVPKKDAAPDTEQRVAVPEKIVRWLEEHRLYGT